MPQEYQPVAFVYCSKKDYAESVHDPNTFYFLYDSREIYVGDEFYSKGAE